MVNSMTRVSPAQRKIHVSTEAIAVFAIAPFLVWAASRDRKLNNVEKGLLVATAAGTVIVDGWLLHRFWRQQAAAPVLRAANPWRHEGGGCMVGEFAKGKELPCDDTFVETTTGEKREFGSTTDGHFEGWHRKGGTVTHAELATFEGRPDVRRLRNSLGA